MEAELTKARGQLQLRQQQLPGAAGTALSRHRKQLETMAARLDAMSPLKVLARGYSITENDRGQALTDAGALKPGDHITIRFHRGTAEAVVEACREEQA